MKMTERTIPWCCEAFSQAFDSERPGVLVTGRKLQDGSMFMLARRATEAEPAVLESEIAFCPWCGTRLAQRYGGHPELFMNIQ